MECSTVADRVAAYLDGELARSEGELFEAHLESCTSCQDLIDRVAAVDLTPPPPLPETAAPAFWSAMDQRLAAEMAAVQTEEIKAANQPPVVVVAPTPSWWRRVMQWELRVSFPVVAGYAALLALALMWSWSNLERAESAEFTNQNLAEQLEREQRQQAPQRPVSASESRTVSTPYRVKF